MKAKLQLKFQQVHPAVSLKLGRTTGYVTNQPQPPPQALRFLHGRGERETSDW